jgi:REP element-mobilizing transposase RayT
MPQSFANVLIHLVFSTKDRRAYFGPPISAELYAYLAAVVRNAGCECCHVGGAADHVHLAIRFSRTLTIAKLVEDLKTASSKWLKTKSPDFAGFAWQRGYGAFSVGPTDFDALIAYIARQAEHHREETFCDEYRAFLRKYGISFDERYMWD